MDCTLLKLHSLAYELNMKNLGFPEELRAKTVLVMWHAS